MNINPIEQRLFDIAKRNAAVAVQAAAQYAAAQNKLQIGQVLSADRLCCEAGTRESLATIERLRALTESHKKSFADFMIRSSAETVAVLNGLRENERSEYLQSLAERTHWHLSSQNAFYEAREQWIDAATRICRLAQSCRHTAVFTDVVRCARDAEYEEFTAQMARIETAHRQEALPLNEKLEGLAKSLVILGIEVK